MVFRHTQHGTFHTTYIPEPHPDWAVIGYLPTMYGNTRTGYTLLGPWAKYEDAYEQARAEAMLTGTEVDFCIDGIRIARFSPNGEAQTT